MKTKLEKLLERKGELITELRTLSEVDAAELTDEQDTRAAEIEAELETRSDDGKVTGLLADIKRETEREELRSRALADEGKPTGEPGSQPDAWRSKANTGVRTKTDPFDLSGLPAYGEKRASECKARALDAIERSTRFVSDEHKEAATKLIERRGHDSSQTRGLSEFILLGASDVYADAFLRKMVGEDLTVEERSALSQRAMLARSLGLSDVTGVLIPSHLDTTIILANAGRTNPLRRLARTETGTTNVYTSVRTSGVSHSWKAEDAEVDDNSPSFENPTVTAYKGTVFVPISFEAFEDARGAESEIIALINDEIDDVEATVFATGNGTSQPRGLITALDANTNAEVSSTTNGVFGQADLYKLYEALPPRYRNDRTQWLANLTVLNDVQQFDTQANANVRNYPAIMARVSEYSAMDGDITTSGTNNVLAVGDPSTYLIYDRLGLSVEFVPNLFGTTNGRPTGQRGWLAHHRTGANLTVGHAASDTVVGWRLLQVTNA
jgi:HK97 family phage major capsid protein